MQKFLAIAGFALVGIFTLWFFSDDRSPPLVKEVTVSSGLAELLSDQGIEGYAKAEEARQFTFPDDHGPHPEYRNEWWYVTGNLDGPAAERFGFELTLFRFALAPLSVSEPRDLSAWRTNQIFIGHFAVTDVARQKFHVAERFARASVGLAGARARPFRVWLENWSLASIEDSSSTWRARATAADMELDLTLTPLKPLVFNGLRGLSQKSDKPGNATYYYSIPRLQTEGSLQINGTVFPVSGLSWLDREWGSSGLSSDQQGWDWFVVQLSDGSDLMFYSLRKLDGSQDAHSAGTGVNRQGNSTPLGAKDVIIEVLAYWDSPLGTRYPAAWRILCPLLDLDLQLEPVFKNQELNTSPRYWEGAVNVTGAKGGVAIDGRGYVELTGYANEPRR
jgi:predicted secreted hydrolase